MNSTADFVEQMLGESGERRESAVRQRDQKLVSSYLHGIRKWRNENKRVRRLKRKGHVRVVTWNVQSWTDVHHQDTFQDMVKLLSERLDADVLCLQEVVWDDRAEQHFKENGYRLIGFHKAKESYDHGNAILARQNVRMVLTAVINLPEGIGEQRCAVVANLVDDEGVPLVQIVCLHLDVYDNTGTTRAREVEAILSTLKAMEKQSGQVDETVLLGDFNAVRKENYHPREWHRMGRPNQVFDLLSDWFVHKPAPPFTVWSGLVVDHVVLGPEWKKYRTRLSPLFTPLSDHLPLVFDIMDVYAPAAAITSGVAS